MKPVNLSERAVRNEHAKFQPSAYMESWRISDEPVGERGLSLFR